MAAVLLYIISSVETYFSFYDFGSIAPCTPGQLRLVGGSITNEGRVEICLNNV